jgi:hypothetical protein
MRDHDLRLMPAPTRRNLWVESEDPTAILGNPWGDAAPPVPTEPGGARRMGLIVQAIARLHHAAPTAHRRPVPGPQN